MTQRLLDTPAPSALPPLAYPLLVTPELRAAITILLPDAKVDGLMSTPLGKDDERVVSLALIDESTFIALESAAQDAMQGMGNLLHPERHMTRAAWLAEEALQGVGRRLYRALLQAEANPVRVVVQ